MIQAIPWDHDGVLVDSEPQIFPSELVASLHFTLIRRRRDALDSEFLRTKPDDPGWVAALEWLSAPLAALCFPSESVLISR